MKSVQLFTIALSFFMSFAAVHATPNNVNAFCQPAGLKAAFQGAAYELVINGAGSSTVKLKFEYSSDCANQESELKSGWMFKSKKEVCGCYNNPDFFGNSRYFLNCAEVRKNGDLLTTVAARRYGSRSECTTEADRR